MLPLAQLDDTPQNVILGDYIFKRIADFELGFYMPYGAIGYRPRVLSEWITEPAVFASTQIWFLTAAGWDRFPTYWTTDSNDYVGQSGGDWDLEDSFGWEHEYDVRNPPEGNDALVKTYVTINPNHRSWDFTTKVTPLTTSLLNIGYEVRWFVKTEFFSRISWVYVEREGGVEAYYPINQIKDIKLDVPDSILRFGLVYGTPDGSSDIPPDILFIMDLEQYGWDHKEIETLQVNVDGTDYWMLRAGGTNLGTPQTVAQDEEVVF
jgi:hypothetical protein